MVYQIKSFTVLPLTIPSTPAFPKSTTHTLYLQPHTPKIPVEEDSRSLFLLNVPIDSTPAHLRGIFTSLLGAAGRVEDIHFGGERRKAAPTAPAPKLPVGKKRKRGHEDVDLELDVSLPETSDRALHRSGGTAIIVFVDKKSAEAALKAIRKLHKSGKTSFPVWGGGLSNKIPALGGARYETYHALRYPDAMTLQMNVDNYMTAFNENEERKKREDKKKRNVPDEDGFVTVTKGGRSGTAKREDVEEKRIEMEEREEKKRRELERAGFYRFQVREQRKLEQSELVKQFEEDKRRVEKLREIRGKRGVRP
ncbi:hypothetical protein HYALB_00007825 [Hymenoscyphus albidus]|uniref:Ribosomal RNA-processing protein 7 n=1 Tax=Hymenoscyphus albidus TaxID=595503 RepID=A0A9N9Q1P7_9HELO|nr:hypothetical protein HYALB_00007825 [Hymenoscyphus albidus]